MHDYDVIVIGAGNGGLTAAAGLARKGARVLLLERHNVPGGAATSFCRGRFEFEVALHQLSGMGTPQKPGMLRLALERLGVLEKLEFVELADLYHVVFADGWRLTLPADRDRALAELKAAFPAERQALTAYFDLLARFAEQMVGAFVFRDPQACRDKYPLLYSHTFRSAKSVLGEHFRDPLLKAVLSVYWGYLGVPPSRLAFAYLAMIFFQYCEFKPYHIKGGSQALSNAILDAFLAAGGTARFNCAAERIEVADGAVAAVVTEGGERFTTRFVVANLSPITVYTRLVDPSRLPGDALAQLRGRRPSTSAFALYIGFDAEPADLGITESTNFLMAATDIGDGLLARMQRLEITDELMVLSCYDVADPEFSPAGACQANVVTLKYGEPWLRIPPERYAEEKYRVAEGMLARVEAAFPGVRARIEEIEAATPLTHMRYLGHPAGAIYGWEQLTKDSLFFQPGRRSALEGLLFAGGWTGDCGFEPTLNSGLAAARTIAKQL